ncbi:MAG: nitroreductase family deazaflavin-dependent oxidoreductase [Ktedonobacteraceae bacterium]|nr:nitroreductase family deazaflavin-dependent oxidoreductase [Ktedonobacteraceae bacterium]
MPKRYQTTALMRINNAVITSLLRMGVTLGSFSLLTVRGRKSGNLVQTPIAIFAQEGKRYLVTPYGIVNWVRNLRAAKGEATITRNRRTEKIRAIELEPAVAASIFRAAVLSGPPGIPVALVRWYRAHLVLPYLNITETSTLEEFEHEVQTHPVFLVSST